MNHIIVEEIYRCVRGSGITDSVMRVLYESDYLYYKAIYYNICFRFIIKTDDL